MKQAPREGRNMQPARTPAELMRPHCAPDESNGVHSARGLSIWLTANCVIRVVCSFSSVFNICTASRGGER